MTNIIRMRSLCACWPEGVCPETKWVEGSNFVDVNVKVDPRTEACDYDGCYG